MVVDKTLALALLTNIVSQQASGAVPLGIRPVGAKVSGICEVQSLQAVHRGKLEAVTHTGHGGVNEPLIIGVLLVDGPETDKGLVDEYESNDSCEYLLCESGEEFHHSTRVECHQAYHEEGRPHSNPEPEIEEWNIV